MGINFSLPPPRQPVATLVRDEEGRTSYIIDRTWYRYFLSLFQATGSGQAGGGPPVAVTPTPSPFTYTATASGTLIISDGGISNVEFSRNGTTFYTTGSFRGMFPLSNGDRMRVTYQSAPTMTFVPF